MVATLTLIGEPFPDADLVASLTAVQDLALALAGSTPRGCGVEMLVGRTSTPPELNHPKLAVHRMQLPASALPVMWQSGTAARSLDGALVHSLTAMAPLRSREDDSQSTVTIPHALPWEAPECMPGQTARLMRAFTRRAMRHADLIITPTHAVAEVLRGVYGSNAPIRVVPLAAPSSFLRPKDADARRAALGLPERYILTSASQAEHCRLDWILDALEASPELPDLVVLGTPPEAKGAEEAPARPRLDGRVHYVSVEEQDNVGVAISGALLLVQPQISVGSGYVEHGALAQGVPILHASIAGTAEIALDGGVAFTDAADLLRTLNELCSNESARGRLALLAEDRGRTFTWRSTAWHLWELHADM